LGENDDAASPGQQLRHYAPNAPMTLYAPPADSARAAMCATAERLLTEGKRVGILAFDADAAAFAPLGVNFVSMGAEADLDGVAHGLFEALRAADHGGAVDVILARGPAQTGMGLAVWDRLVRAAEGRIITS
jgi:L-threonylcarbamoyladenylate synthase